jgi:cytochrome c oxidase assembly protein subunit 15
VAGYNARRVEIYGVNPITPFQIGLQLAHRGAALAIFILVAACAWQTWRRLGGRDSLTKLALGWLALILAQVALGAATIWYNKAADVATAHVLVGALALTLGALWCILAFRRSEPLTETQPLGAFGAQPVLAANK